MLFATIRREAERCGEPRARRSGSWCRRSRRIRAAARRLRPAPRRSGAWSRRSAAACARKKCAASTGCARRRCVYDGISASPASLGLVGEHRATSAAIRRCSSGMRRFRYSRRSTATCSLRDRPVCSRRPASPTRADQLALDERVHVLVLPRRLGLEERRDRDAPRRERSPRARRAIAERVRASRHAGALAAPPPTPGCPRTSSSNSRRSKRNDAPNSNSAASGSPANRPDQRCAIGQRPTGAGRPRRLARGGLDRQAPDLDEALRRRCDRKIARVVGGQRLIVRARTAIAGRRRGSRL